MGIRRDEQLFQRHPQSVGELGQRLERQVLLPGLHLLYVAQGHLEPVRYLLLGRTAGSADLADTTTHALDEPGWIDRAHGLNRGPIAFSHIRTYKFVRTYRYVFQMGGPAPREARTNRALPAFDGSAEQGTAVAVEPAARPANGTDERVAKAMRWMVLWCVAMGVMYSWSLVVGMAFGVGTGTALYWLETTKHRARFDRLRLEYERQYGPHPGYDDQGQRYGAAAGAVLGGGFGGAYVVGSLFGAGTDYLRSAKRKLLMPTDQAHAYETLRRLSAYRPGAALALYLMWMLLGAGGVRLATLVAGTT